MVWKETCAVDERMRFVLAVEGQEEAMAAVCRRVRDRVARWDRRCDLAWTVVYLVATAVNGFVCMSILPRSVPSSLQRERLAHEMENL